MLSRCVKGDEMPDRLFFSTDSLPERDRFPAFCEEIIRRYAALDIIPRGDGLFRGVIEMRRAGPVDVSSRFTTPTDYVRSPRLVGDGNDSVFVVLCRSGGAYQSQLGYDVTLQPGNAVLCDCGYAGGIHMTTDSSFASVKAPRAAITYLLPRMNRLAGVKLNRDDVALRLLFGYLGGTLDVGLMDGARATQLYGEHIIDLIALALGAEGDAREIVEQRSVAAVRRAAILREIDKLMADPNLNAAAIASRHGITRANFFRTRFGKAPEPSRRAFAQPATAGSESLRNRICVRIWRSFLFQSRFSPPLWRDALGHAREFPPSES